MPHGQRPCAHFHRASLLTSWRSTERECVFVSCFRARPMTRGDCSRPISRCGPPSRGATGWHVSGTARDDCGIRHPDIAATHGHDAVRNRLRQAGRIIDRHVGQSPDGRNGGAPRSATRCARATAASRFDSWTRCTQRVARTTRPICAPTWPKWALSPEPIADY